MKKHSLSTIYVLLLTLCLPLACFYIWILTILPIPWNSLIVWIDNYIKALLFLMILLLPVIIYWLIIFILGAANIVASFKAYQSGDVYECINKMLIHKYGLVVYFIINFIVAVIWYFLSTFGLLVGSRGLAIFAAPVLLPFLAVSVIVTVTTTWLAIVPGAFWSIQVLRFTLREKKIGIIAAVLHGIMQFVFLIDVLDAMYLSVIKWGRGKKSSLVVGVVYILALITIFMLFIWLRFY